MSMVISAGRTVRRFPERSQGNERLLGECEWTDSEVSVASVVTTEGRADMLLELRSWIESV